MRNTTLDMEIDRIPVRNSVFYSNTFPKEARKTPSLILVAIIEARHSVWELFPDLGGVISNTQIDDLAMQITILFSNDKRTSRNDAGTVFHDA